MEKPTGSFENGWGCRNACLKPVSLEETCYSCPYSQSHWAFSKTGEIQACDVKESTTQSGRDANVQILTGRKWKAHAEVVQAISRLQQKKDNRQSSSRKGRPWA